MSDVLQVQPERDSLSCSRSAACCGAAIFRSRLSHNHNTGHTLFTCYPHTHTDTASERDIESGRQTAYPSKRSDRQTPLLFDNYSIFSLSGLGSELSATINSSIMCSSGTMSMTLASFFF